MSGGIRRIGRRVRLGLVFLVIAGVGGFTSARAAAPETLADTALNVVRQFFTAVVDKDRTAMAKVILPQEQSEALFSGPHPLAGKDAAWAKSALDQMTCRLLQPGEVLTLKNGRQLKIVAPMVNETNQLALPTIAGEVLAVPIRLVRTNSEWRVDAAPFIKASLAARQAAERKLPKP